MKSKAVLYAIGTSIVAVLSCFAPGMAIAAGFPTSGTFDQIRTITVPRLTFRDVQSISFKGNDIRVETADPSSYLPLTQIETPDAMFVYSPAAPEAEKIPLDQKQPPLLDRMDADTKSNLAGATKTGSGSFEGYSCDIYATTADNGNEDVVIWVSKDPKFPFKLKTIATDKALNKVTTIILENISLGVSLDDSLFQVPENIKIVTETPKNQSQTPSGGVPGH